MANKKQYEQTLNFALVFFITIFDKQENILCSIGIISRPIFFRDHNATDQVIPMDRYQRYFKKTW